MLKKLATALLSLVLVACFAQSALALETIWYPGTIPVGLDGRSLGMGGACLAVTDAWAYPINPAALVFLADQGMLAGRFINPNKDTALGLGDQTYMYLCYIYPDMETGNGYALTYYQDTFDNEWTGTGFSHTLTRFTAFQYGYGHRFSDQISLGINFRRVDTLDEYNTDSDAKSGIITIDAGAVFRLNKMATASILITDVLAPNVEFSGDTAPASMEYQIEARILFGGSFRIGDLVLLAMDVDYGDGGWEDLAAVMESVRFGAEFHLGPIFLRGGFYHSEPTIGLGLRLGNRHDKMEINLDIGQFYPSSGSLTSPVTPATCLQMKVFF